MKNNDAIRRARKKYNAKVTNKTVQFKESEADLLAIANGLPNFNAFVKEKLSELKQDDE